MPQISLDGVVHDFPEGTTDDEIQQVLGDAPEPPALRDMTQAAVRRVDNAIEEKSQYARLLGGMKLSTKDKNFYLGFFRPAHEVLEDERNDLTPANFAELEREIKKTKDPKVRATLTEEHHRMKKSMADILGIK